MWFSRLAPLAVAASLVLTAVPAVASPDLGPDPGPGSHDTLFPGMGHGGYDVLAYNVHLRYDQVSNHLAAVTTVKATPTHRLTSFTLDLSGLTVHHVSVDGRTARWHRDGHQLVITPSTPLTRTFKARIAYSGVPLEHTDSDGSTEGWVRTTDGAIGLGEPVGTMTWVPSDNTPGDKATWTFHVDVPSDDKVAANGVLVSRTPHGDRSTWLWRERDPMTTYLATVGIGRFHLYHSSITSITGRRIPVWSFIDPATPDLAAPARQMLPGVISFEENLFGPYPFTSTGMIVDNADVGYALETQTRPFYPGNVLALVHEMAHQWYGDDVSFVDWHDIWLAEGFATYTEWLYDAAHGGESTQATFAQQYAKPASDNLWNPSPRGFTSSVDLFGSPVYTRGAMTLEALREKIGDAAFFAILKAWPRIHRHGNAHTADFVRLAERISGIPLGGFFHDWLDRPGKPSGY